MIEGCTITDMKGSMHKKHICTILPLKLSEFLLVYKRISTTLVTFFSTYNEISTRLGVLSFECFNILWCMFTHFFHL